MAKPKKASKQHATHATKSHAKSSSSAAKRAVAHKSAKAKSVSRPKSVTSPAAKTKTAKPKATRAAGKPQKKVVVKAKAPQKIKNR